MQLLETVERYSVPLAPSPWISPGTLVTHHFISIVQVARGAETVNTLEVNAIFQWIV